MVVAATAWSTQFQKIRQSTQGTALDPKPFISIAQILYNRQTRRWPNEFPVFYPLSEWLDIRSQIAQSPLGDLQTYVTSTGLISLDSDVQAALARSGNHFGAWRKSVGADPCAEFGNQVVEQSKSWQTPPAGTESSASIETFTDAADKCIADKERRKSLMASYTSLTQEDASAIINLFEKASDSIRSQIQKTADEITILDKQEIETDIAIRKKADTIIDESARQIIATTLWAWMGILVIVVLAILMIGRFGVHNHGSNQTTPAAPPFNYEIFLEMMSVFILTATILILGLAARLNNEAVAALIGGISGYVLGRIQTGPRQDK